MTTPMTGEAATWHPLFNRGETTTTLLLLHGTGGDEHSLLGLGRALAPSASFLSVRGRSMEEGFPRFFRRFNMTSYDQESLEQEADALATLVTRAADHYSFDPSRVVVLGYSNGANIGLASCVRNPHVYAGLVLIRPVMPFEKENTPHTDLSGKQVLLLVGERDPYRRSGESLPAYLGGMGAEIAHEVVEAGHELGTRDLAVAAEWLEQKGFLE
jgi:phospholipase/carboxylesterase